MKLSAHRRMTETHRAIASESDKLDERAGTTEVIRIVANAGMDLLLLHWATVLHAIKAAPLNLGGQVSGPHHFAWSVLEHLAHRCMKRQLLSSTTIHRRSRRDHGEEALEGQDLTLSIRQGTTQLVPQLASLREVAFDLGSVRSNHRRDLFTV